jgi:hypothetical protein
VQKAYRKSFFVNDQDACSKNRFQGWYFRQVLQALSAWEHIAYMTQAPQGHKKILPPGLSGKAPLSPSLHTAIFQEIWRKGLFLKRIWFIS